MYRVPGEYAAEHIEVFAKLAHVRPVYRLARCEHGKAWHESCRDCEYGYVQDTYPYAYCGPVATSPDGDALIATTDDGEYVVYIPARYQSRVNRVLASHTA